MSRPLIVYGKTLGWSRDIVAATTKKTAREALGVSAYEFERYVGDTGNTAEIAVASREPGQPFTQPTRVQIAPHTHWWRGTGMERPWESRPADVIEED